jgi:hypothetical protein
LLLLIIRLYYRSIKYISIENLTTITQFETLYNKGELFRTLESNRIIIFVCFL